MTALTPITKTARVEAPVHRWRAFAVLAVAYFMTIVDLTIVNVALPPIGRQLPRLRACDHRLVLDRDAWAAGTRRRDRAARGALDRDEHVRRGRRAQQGARHLGRHRRRGRDRRTDRRWSPHSLPRLAVHLLPQRPDRRACPPARAPPRPRESPRDRASALRRLRRDHLHRGPAAARLRSHESAAV